MEEITNIIDRIIASGKITNIRRVELNHNLYAAHEIGPEKQTQLERLNQQIEEGKVILAESKLRDRWMPRKYHKADQYSIQ